MIKEEYKNPFFEVSKLAELIGRNENYLSCLQTVIDICTECLKRGNKLMIAGNGGSAADAQHFATELVGRYLLQRKGYSAIALTTDTSFITAWSNDYDFNTVFSRQVEALGKNGDVFIGISTSGRSNNIFEAVKSAKTLGITTVGLLGYDGGAIKEIIDYPLVVASRITPRIQEIHLITYHHICEEVEKRLLINDG